MKTKVLECLNIWGSILSGSIGYYLGGWDILLKAILIFMILDFLTGWLKAIFYKKLSSEVGAKGIIKKVVVFMIIGVANILQKMLGENIPLRETVIMFYCINEILSIIENAACFVPIPGKLRQTLKQLQDEYIKEDEKNQN